MLLQLSGLHWNVMQTALLCIVGIYCVYLDISAWDDCVGEHAYNLS